ncbi:MAG TPA: methyltransferase domain-containing protein [Longimicrobiales bacterium]
MLTHGDSRPMLTDGYPRLDLYEEIPDDHLFREMREFARRFQEANRSALQYYSRRWVDNPLHHWSRRWEYLWVTERFAALVEERAGETLRVLDAGSGLTFFAHWLAHEFPSLRIECCDRDARAAAAAARLVPPAVPSVAYATQDLAALTFEGGVFDAIACVSVLEHTGRHETIVEEFARVLRPGGRLVLTIDISLDGRWAIPIARARELVAALARRFEPSSDYAACLERFDRERMLTTEHARRIDATLLPWKYPSLRDAWERRNPALLLRPKFKDLTCFCMTWSRRA